MQQRQCVITDRHNVKNEGMEHTIFVNILTNLCLMEFLTLYQLDQHISLLRVAGGIFLFLIKFE